MLTVLESLNLSTKYLQKKGIESPRINAELLLAHILNCKRLDLYLAFDRPLTENETNLYREFLKRRSNFEPLQYIIGSVEFYGLNFKVNSSVLIPRQETEVLVESVIENTDKEVNISILDIGTGSGNIAICIGKNLPDSKITAIDNDPAALKIARENAIQNNSENILFLEKDILKNGNYFAGKFDVIVSNPPYISEKDFFNLAPELKVYEPKNALTDKNDGFTFYKIISEKAKDILTENGKLFFELGINQSEEVKKIMIDNNFKNIKIKKDYLGIERVIYGELF